MREGQQDGSSEIEQALQLILAAAKNYQGPYAREFAEIARRCTPSAPEELIGELVKNESDLSAGETRKPVDLPDSERHPYKSESREPNEKLAEVLAILLKVAFPPDKSIERAVRDELGEVLNIKVSSLSFIDGDDVVQVKQHLCKPPKKADRILRAALQQYIPGSDSLHD